MPAYAQYTSQYTPQAFQAPFPTQASEQRDRHQQLHLAITQASVMPGSSVSVPPQQQQQRSMMYPSSVSTYQNDTDDGDDSDGGVAVPASF